MNNDNQPPLTVSRDHFTGRQPSAQRLVITSFEIQPMHGYRNMVRRPWEATFTGEIAQKLGNIAREARAAVDEGMHPHEGERFTPDDLLEIAHAVLKPTATHQGVVDSPAAHEAGWKTPVCRFHITATIHSPAFQPPVTVHYVGYTDRMGILADGQLDPDMIFTISAAYHERETKYRDDYGIKTMSKVSGTHYMADSGHGSSDSPQMSLLRPQDVVGRMCLNTSPGLMNSSFPVVDMRGVLTTRPMASHIDNGDPATYLAKIMNSLEFGEFHGQRENISRYEAASSFSVEPNRPFRDPLMRALSDVAGDGTGGTVKFKFSDLLYVDNFMAIHGALKINCSLGHVTMDDSLEDSSIEAVMVTSVITSLPAMMAEAGIRKFSVDCTPNVCSLHNLINFAGEDVDMKGNDQLSSRIVNSLVAMLGMKNGAWYTVTIVGDLFGDMCIRVSTWGLTDKTFRVPLYASSLFTPLQTADTKTIDNLAIALDALYASSVVRR